MEFVKVFDTATVSGTEVMKEIGHYHDCGADDVAIEWLESKTRCTITVSDIHTFLGCVSKYVDEHTYDAWSAQASLQRASMRRPGGRNMPGEHGAPSPGAYACKKLPSEYKAGKGDWKIKLKDMLEDEVAGIGQYLELQKIAPLQLRLDIEDILKDERRHVEILSGYFK